MNRPRITSGIQLAVRAAVAAGLSLALAQLLNLQHPLYAMIAAVIVTDLAPAESRQLGLRRLLATVVGAVCGATLTVLLPPSPWAIVLGILIAMLMCQLLRAPEAARVAGFICGIVLLDHSAEPWSYALFRFVETALGIAVAWAISYVPKLFRIDDSAET